MQQSRELKHHLVLATALFVAAAAGAVIAHTPLTMSEGFEKALNTSRAELSFKPHTTDNRPGDEGYWLTRAEVQSPALFAKPVAIGDRITISGNDGETRRLEVIDVKAVGSPAGHDAISLLLVTARINEDPSEKSTVRFIVEGQLAKPAPQTVSKAL